MTPSPRRGLSWARYFPSLILLISGPSVRAQAQTDLSLPTWSVKQLVEFQQRLHPHLQVQDVYKLFYEAAFGVRHILADSSAAVSELTGEWESADSMSPGEQLLERISLSDDIVRVNLRPFKSLNLNPVLLVNAMSRSARETLPDTLMFNRLWNEFSALVRYGLLRFPADEVKAWDLRVEGGGSEALHHSSEYSAANRPAYRVLRRAVFEKTFGTISQ